LAILTNYWHRNRPQEAGECVRAHTRRSI